MVSVDGVCAEWVEDVAGAVGAADVACSGGGAVCGDDGLAFVFCELVPEVAFGAAEPVGEDAVGGCVAGFAFAGDVGFGSGVLL